MERKVRNTPSRRKRGRKKSQDVKSERFKKSPRVGCQKKETMYVNIDEESIVYPLNKLELRLRDYQKRPVARARDLGAAVTSPIALLFMFYTTEFHDKFGVSALSWQVFWGVCLLVSFVWSVNCVISAIRIFRSKKTIKEFIEELKGECKTIVKNRDLIYFYTNIGDKKGT